MQLSQQKNIHLKEANECNVKCVSKLEHLRKLNRNVFEGFFEETSIMRTELLSKTLFERSLNSHVSVFDPVICLSYVNVLS